jgi:para-nitrobenzyl esterase
MRPIPFPFPFYLLMSGILLAAGSLSGQERPLFDYRSPPEGQIEVEVRKDLVYGKAAVNSGASFKDLKADAYIPRGLDGYRKAAIIFIHGGGFRSGDKRGYHVDGRYFASRGFVVFSINYRLKRDRAPLAPGQKPGIAAYARAAFVDGKTAVRWVHANAESFGIDPENIFLSGTSAGAVVALAAGVTGPDSFTTDIPGQPIPSSNSPGASNYVKGIIDFCGGLYGLIDSIDIRDPAILIYHGTRDRKVPFAQALAVRDKCMEAGVYHEFYPIEGKGHCPNQPAANGKDLRRLTHEFILTRMDTGDGPVLQKSSFRRF